MKQIAKQHTSGQAMAEFAIGLFAMIVVTLGMIHLSHLAVVSLRQQAELRGETGKAAMQDSTFHNLANYIRDWSDGEDGIAFTADDQSSSGSLFAPVDTLLSRSVATPRDWDYPEDHTTLPASLLSLRSSTQNILPCIIKTKEEDFPVDPFIQRYIYTKESVRLSTRLVMPSMGGMY